MFQKMHCFDDDGEAFLLRLHGSAKSERTLNKRGMQATGKGYGDFL